MSAGTAAGRGDPPSPEERVVALQAELAEVKTAAKAHVGKVEQRQDLSAAVLAGRSSPEEIEAAMADNEELAVLTPELRASLGRVEQRQAALAAKAQKVAELRYTTTAAKLRKLGLNPQRFTPTAEGMGGPSEPTDGKAAPAETRSAEQLRRAEEQTSE